MSTEKPRMGGLCAVKRHLESGEHGKPVSVGEFKAFWETCSKQEKADFARDAAKALGVELNDDAVAKAA